MLNCSSTQADVWSYFLEAFFPGFLFLIYVNVLSLLPGLLCTKYIFLELKKVSIFTKKKVLWHFEIFYKNTKVFILPNWYVVKKNLNKHY